MFFVRFLLLEEMFEKQSNLSRDYRYCHKKRASFGVDFSTRHVRAVGTGKTGCLRSTRKRPPRQPNYTHNALSLSSLIASRPRT